MEKEQLGNRRKTRKRRRNRNKVEIKEMDEE